MNLQVQMLESNSTLARAYLLMERYRLPNLPVASAGEVVGVICERDIESLLQNFSDVRSERGLKVGNYMRSPVRSIEHDARIDTVAKLMIDGRINAVILKKGEEVVGALTKDDLLEVFAELLTESPHSVLDAMQAFRESSSRRRASSKKI
jgi:predicted transcriptional regulator